MRAQNADYVPQGFPVPAPNALHTEEIDVRGDFHIDFNKLLAPHRR
jgi:hypothetical protein